MNKYLLTIILCFTISCKMFWHPYTMKLKVPDGPPAFKAGWYNGCRSALSVKKFANSMVYDAAFGNGVYQHDPLYQTAWANAWFNCYVATGEFTTRNPAFTSSPLR